MNSSPSKRPTHVLVVYQYFAHYRLPVIQALAELPAESNYKFTFASDNRSNLESLNVLQFGMKSSKPAVGNVSWKHLRNVWFGKLALWQRGLLRLVVSRDYDVLIFLGDRRYISTWCAACLARLLGKPVLFWTHGYRKRLNGLNGCLTKCFYKLADGLLLYGQRGKQLAEEAGINSDRLFVIHNSLDFEEQNRLQQAFLHSRGGASAPEPRPEVLRLVFSGRLTATKRVDLLLLAVKKFREENAPVTLTIIGDGSELQNLMKMAESYAIADVVVFMRECYNEDELCEIFTESDIFVSPGDVGLACIHAMGYGLPVITHGNSDSQKPEVAAILPGVTGDFFQQNSVNELLATISKWMSLLAKNRERVRRQCIGRISSTYTAANQVSSILRALENTIKTKK